MPVYCDFILRRGATPEELSALGLALWGWCLRVSGDAGVYPNLDNQTLADLIAGVLPVVDRPASALDRRGTHFRVRGDTALDRAATIAALHRAVPEAGVEDILVDGISWTQAA